MAVAATRSVGSGLYVPFRGIDRRVSPVGTLSIDATITGAAGGGTATITIAMAKDEFGFHPIWILTRAYVTEDNNVAQEVLFTYLAAGNERIQGSITEEVTSRVTINGDNVGNAGLLAIPIEPDQQSQADVFLARWAVNTDTNIYHLHMFGVLYDAQAMAASKEHGARVDTFMAGVR